MAPPAAPAPRYQVGTWPVSRLFMLAAFVCFLIAALCAGGVVSWPMWAWGFGGFASYALAWVF
jgi:hypothetical protein